jgi:hypothetical protein
MTTLRILVAFMLAGAAPATVQSGLTLSSLTVPAERLSSGCALEQPPSPAPVARGGATVVHAATPSQFPANPWSGTDRKLVAAVHMAVDARREKPLPDVPPTTARDAAASDTQWAENIREAYHAAYASAEGSHVQVFAVTFNDAKLITPEPVSAMLNPPRGLTRRIVRGTTVVRVSAPAPTECFGAIRAYIESLK